MLRFARNSMATTRRSEIVCVKTCFTPHVNNYGNYCAPVRGAPVNPEPTFAQTELLKTEHKRSCGKRSAFREESTGDSERSPR
eukprot:2550235-Heterocapsa_arctica.AAC.1